MSVTIQRNPKTTYKLVDSVVYILDPRTSTIHTLNDTSSFIWNHIKKPVKIGDLVALITEEYDVPYKTAQKDADVFIKKYIAAGYIKRVY